jgi:hypothetical protein
MDKNGLRVSIIHRGENKPIVGELSIVITKYHWGTRISMKDCDESGTDQTGGFIEDGFRL